MVALVELQREVDERLRCGESFPKVERDVIDASDLAEEDKAALWLYGWTYTGDGPRSTLRPRQG